MKRIVSIIADGEVFCKSGFWGTRDVVDAVPYDGIENGERKTKSQIKTKKATRDKGFPGVSRGFPCAGGFHHLLQFAMRGQRNKAESAKT